MGPLVQYRTDPRIHRRPHADRGRGVLLQSPTAPSRPGLTQPTKSPDSPGRLKPAQTLTWDAEGKLDTLTETGTVKGDYIYTADGDRLLRTEGNTTTAYLPGFELTTTGTTTTATRYYTFAGKTIATRTTTGASGVNTLIADHHGTAEIAINNGTNQATRRYHDPYGNTRGTPTPWADDKGFLGKPTDTTGLTHIGARYYDPQIGRFITVDPIMKLLDPEQWNGYAYSNSNPATFHDPSGLEYCGSSICAESYTRNPQTGVGTITNNRTGKRRTVNTPVSSGNTPSSSTPSHFYGDPKNGADVLTEKIDDEIQGEEGHSSRFEAPERAVQRSAAFGSRSLTASVI